MYVIIYRKFWKTQADSVFGVSEVSALVQQLEIGKGDSKALLTAQWLKLRKVSA